MKVLPCRRLFLLLLLWCPVLMGMPATAALERRTWLVEGVSREALVHLPAKDAGDQGKSSQVVFIFHGHGGTMQHAARTFSIHTHWPEAVCIYMQGLPTVGRLTDPEGKKSGWQARAGDGGDRDLKFFDAVLASLQREQSIDPRRIYATGHSNGGAFTYLLWAQRGDVFAAVAPSAAVAAGQLRDLRPKPVLHFAGQQDPLVRYGWQEATIAALRRINQCDTTTPLQPGMNHFPGTEGCPVWCYIHSGGHEFTPDASGIMVDFFKKHPKR